MERQGQVSENRFSFFDANMVSDWLALHIKNILYGIAAAIVIIIALYSVLYHDAQLSESEYQKAANDFAIFSRPSTSDNTNAQNEALKSLLSSMSKHKDLQAAYGGSIAQILINRGDVANALPLAQQTLARIEADHIAMYEQYAQTTLLILEKKYPEALIQAQSLKSQMESEIKAVQSWENRSFSPELFPINLFRIGMLQQQLGDKAGEIATWKLWNQYSGIGSSSDINTITFEVRPFHMLTQQLAIGSMTLPDYINSRLKELEKEK